RCRRRSRTAGLPVGGNRARCSGGHRAPPGGSWASSTARTPSSRLRGPGTTRGLRPGDSPSSSPEGVRSEEHTSELQSRGHLVCRLLLEKKKRGKVVVDPGGGDAHVIAEQE